MDDDAPVQVTATARESPRQAQRNPGCNKPDENTNGTAASPVVSRLIATNDLSENQHQRCNDSSCDILANKMNETSGNGNAHQFTGHHHYHYIEYPGMYYQKKTPQNVQSTSTNTYHYCVCSCSSDDRMKIVSEPLEPSLQVPSEQQESRLAVAAIVHHHQSLDVECGQSLLSHSYQMLNIPPTPANEKKSTMSSSCHSKLHINDCDSCTSATCSCMTSPEQQQQPQHESQRPTKRCKKLNNTVADSMLATADEITVSESDNNGSLTKRKNIRESRVQKKINSWYAKNYNCNHIEIYSDGDGDGDGHGDDGGGGGDNNHRNDHTITQHDSLTNILDQRPPLPPRPQPIAATQNGNNSLSPHRPGSQSIKKYVIWCLVCGGFSCLLGALFLGVYFLLHSYTITVGNFETVPTFVPATLLILTGLCIMSLARRRNRYSYLIKLSGACGLTSALTCALVTVTTTVLHMSRLQALRECEYAQKTRTCTCYSDMIESQVDRVDKEGVRLVFDSLSDCGVVHGSLYSCLRAIFGLSVAGVLVAVFSCMLVYQLLSHERKKMYWEQLELRCRSLYTSHQQHQQHQPQGPSAHSMAALSGISARNAPICRCCEQCHAHRQLQLQTASYPWVDDSGEPRFWAGQPPGNFYSPNPGGDDNNLHASAGPSNRSRISSGWSWPRMPWQRSSTESGGNRFRQIPSSPDSQYGFSSANPSLGLAVSNVAVATAGAGEDDATAAAVAAVAAATATQRAAQAYNIVAGGAALPYGIWGPPPPYSDPNSPARRGYYQYMQPLSSICTTNRIADNGSNVGNNGVDTSLQQRPLSASALNAALAAGSTPNVDACITQRTFDHISQRICTADQMHSVYKSKENSLHGVSMNNGYSGNTGSDSDIESVPTRFSDRFSNTLPTRKIKKRVVDGSSSIAKCVGSGSRQQLSSHRINVQRVFPNSSNSTSENDGDANSSNTRPLNSHNLRYAKSNSTGNNKDCRSVAYSAESGKKMQISNDLLEKNACMNKCDGNDSSISGAIIPVVPTNCDAPYEDPTESEIYFADVSSCCNISMKNDHGYEDSSRNVQQSATHRLHQSIVQHTSSKQSQSHFNHHQHQHHQHQRSNSNCNCNQSTNPSSGICGGDGCCASEDEDQRFGQRENSIRSRNQNHSQCRQGDGYNKKLNIMVINGGDMIQPTLKSDNKIETSIPKDNSLHSMCSIDSEAKTECTDLSPLTPCSNKNPTETMFQTSGNNIAVPQTPNSSGFSNFIASFPYSSETKFHEAHRRFTKHMRDNLITTATEPVQEAHYEVIHDDNASENKISSLRISSTMTPQSHQQRPKNLNPNCSSTNRMAAHNRNSKAKDNFDSVWTSSDASGSSHHNRHRL